MQALHDAILEALFSGGVLSDEALQQLLGEPADGDQEAARQQLEDLIQQIIERMMEQGFITGAPDLDGEREHRRGAGGGLGEDAGPVRFEVTDKALDFLGYRALRDLLGSIGRSSAGRHDTRHLSTGIETVAAPKPYEFGDTLNIDPSSTILNAVQRLHAEGRYGIRDRGPGIQRIPVPVHRHRLLGPDGRAERVPELVRDGHHARLQPQHDPLRRGPVHAGQARRAGARAPDSHAVSRRLAARGAVPRFGRGDSAQAARPRARRPLLHEHARRPPPGAAHPRAAEEGHAADRDDHRRQAVGADARRTGRSTRTPSASTRTSSPRPSPR